MVDVANVMGARADGWWRDRAGAALRLGNEIAALSLRDGETGAGPVGEWIFVVEGRASGAAKQLADVAPRLRVVAAPGSGDDAIVAIVAELAALGEPCLVVTADRELRRRCEELGASVAGPGWLLRLL